MKASSSYTGGSGGAQQDRRAGDRYGSSMPSQPSHGMLAPSSSGHQLSGPGALIPGLSASASYGSQSGGGSPAPSLASSPYGLGIRRGSADGSPHGSEAGGGGGGGDDHHYARPASVIVNYVPNKFGPLHEPGQYAHRRKTYKSTASSMNGAGGPWTRVGSSPEGLVASDVREGAESAADEAEYVDELVNNRPRVRIGEVHGGDEGRHPAKRGKLVWNRFKIALFAANSIMFAYAVATLVACLLTWFDIFYRADVVKVGNTTELIVSTAAGSLLILSGLIGYAGILLNNRAFLAIYNVLLWACLALIVTPGYMTYKQRTFNLEGKINAQWSRALGAEGRLRIQNQLKCCGYFSPFVEATVSNLCYARSILPGCKSRYLKFERNVLETWYTIAFSLVPAQIGVIVTALLCSNHVTYRFGKGLTPKRYRLDTTSMTVIMDEYASQIAEEYGQSAAKEALERSSSHLSDSKSGFLAPPSRTNSFADVR